MALRSRLFRFDCNVLELGTMHRLRESRLARLAAIFMAMVLLTPSVLAASAALRGQTKSYNWDNQLTGSGFVYDGNGNPTTYDGRTLTFDRNDRVTEFKVGSTVQLKCGYEASGLRAWKEVSGVKTYFLYDGLNAVEEFNSSGAVTAINVYGPDGLIGRKEGSTWSYYTFDQQGNVVQRLDSGQNHVASRIFEAWGQGMESTLPRNLDPFAYNAQWGYYYDRETGLYLCGFRYYDPSNARWLNRDPIGYAGGVNLYGYCQGGPVGAADPSGLSSLNTPHGTATASWAFAEIYGTAAGRTVVTAATAGLATLANNPRILQGLVSIVPRCSSLVPRIGERANQFGMRSHTFFSRGYPSSNLDKSPFPGSGIRPDITDHSRRVIVEIKPWHRILEAIQQGLRYAEKLDDEFPGSPWQVEIWPYSSPWIRF